MEVCVDCSSLATVARPREQSQAYSKHREKGGFSLGESEDATSVGMLVCLARDIAACAHGLNAHHNALDESGLVQEHHGVENGRLEHGTPEECCVKSDCSMAKCGCTRCLAEVDLCFERHTQSSSDHSSLAAQVPLCCVHSLGRIRRFATQMP